MKYTRIMVISIAALLSSCNSEPVDKIVGSYAREITFEDKNPATMKVLGNGTIRDTIFISKKKDGYQVDNTRWLKNDYDQEGWRNLEHAEDHPSPTYTVSYDKTDQSLNPTNPLMANPLYLDFNKGLLCSDRNRTGGWKKVK
jgi:hypothetical protein